jgi:hypothetical protein
MDLKERETHGMEDESLGSLVANGITNLTKQLSFAEVTNKQITMERF